MNSIKWYLVEGMDNFVLLQYNLYKKVRGHAYKYINIFITKLVI